MAIGTQNYALIDLGFDPFPTPTACRQVGNVLDLFVNVMEVETGRIGLAAGTWMCDLERLNLAIGRFSAPG